MTKTKEKAEVQAEATTQVDVAFITMLQQHRKVSAVTELSAALKEATEAVFNQGRPATVTLKLVIKPATRTAGAMVVEDDISIKLPKPGNTTSIFYADKESWALVRDNPDQMALELKTVDGMASHGEQLKEAKV